MGNWSKLKADEKVRVIKFARQNGVSDIKTIRDTYNIYLEGNKGHKYDGDSEKSQRLGIKGRMKDIAYRAMSQGPGEARDMRQVVEAVIQSYKNAPYELNYLGTNMYGAGLGDADPDWNRDSNWMFLYGNTKGHYTPITKEEYRGHSYAPFIRKHYPDKEVLNYYGKFTPVQEVELPSYTRPLVEFLANKDLGTYESVLDVKNDEEFNKYISVDTTIDDVGSFRTGIGHSPQGNPEFQLSDLIDFGGGDYRNKWGTLAGIQGQLLTYVGNPFMLRQYIPIRYTDNPDEINESGIGTLLKIAEDNKVASYNSTDNTFEMLGSLPEVTVTASKATGGPLYPFSFQKNPFLKTPVVRYDEGGKIRDWDNYLTGKLINYAENSDSIGWVPADRTWEHPTLPGYDKNQIGMGVDKNQTEGYSEVIQFRRDGTPFMTELDERRLRHAAIEKANTSANARYEFAQKEVNRPDGTISPVKDAAVVSAIYNLGAGYVANGLFEDRDFMLKLFDGTDKEVVDRINLEYKKKNRNERIAKTNQFLFK